MNLNKLSCLLFGVSLTFASCKHEPPVIPKTGIDPAATQYPLEVANIIINKCATAGCHNEASFAGAGSLRMDDWQYMFDGGSNGAVVVPYSPENSSLLYFINPGSYDNISVKPTMPYNMPPLSKAEYDVIKQWITDGAPDKNGNIPFGSNAATRQKAYMAQQGCDLVGVIDAEKRIIMRYIKTGQSSNVIESPHYIQTDSKGEYAYVCFIAGSIIQKIDMRTDKVIGQADLSPFSGGLNFNIVQVSEAGDKLITSQLSANGGLVLINTADMKVAANLALLESPHGIASNKAFDTFYVTAQYGNTVYKVVQGKAPEKISIDGNPTKTIPGATTPDPHEIIMSPDYSKYFLTCQNTNEVRIMNRANDSLLKVIPTGIMPLELAISTTKSYLFVTCMEDVSQISSLYRGSVYVINYNTLDVVQRIDGTFYQPHGIAVDDRNGTFYVASRNVRSDGPAPHHTSDCGGRNGYYQVYDLNTLKPVNGRRYEVTPDPYSINMRFK